ncbi:MAG: hypothetical protein M3P06_01310 [Acidobacteriota bacterium]|nr:hypothetical protein [Acidobacteriota bacterium]
MTTFPGSPRILKGGIALLDAERGTVLRTIVLQYNPDTLTRTLQVQGAGAGEGDRSEALRLKGAPVETIKLDAEIDASDQLEHPDKNPNAVELGIHPHLAALETIVYPTVAQVRANDALARSGTLEILPMEAPLTIFIWSRNRVVPVRITDFSITEEAFDPMLNPIRAKVSLSMRVLSESDLGTGHRGGALFMVYHQQKETLAARFTASAADFGVIL